MDTTAIKERFVRLKPLLNERQRRLAAAAEAQSLGRGGISAVADATGVARKTIARGLQELATPDASLGQRIRRSGGGRKRAVVKDPTLLADLERLVEPVNRGDPEAPLRWTSKSVRKLADELLRQGHQVSHNLVASLLKELGYRLQANRKTGEGSTHPDRDAQFEYIQAEVKAFQAAGQPVISVDTKKQERVSDFKHNGRELQPEGDPEVLHDVVLPELGKVAPYGVYDVTHNLGWVNVGIDQDTAAFAVASIRRWWECMGQPRYADAQRLLITAEGGAHVRLWKIELQKLADETGLAMSVCHLPPGTSKWNKIEQRLCSFIRQNWRGQPLISHAVIVNWIAATTPKTGLNVECVLDTQADPTGIVVSDEELAQVTLQRADFHGEWNYTILPRPKPTDTVIL